MKTPLVSALALSLFVSVVLPAAAQNGKPDQEGFIRDWLVLAPHSIGDSSGGDEIDKKQFADEAQPAAREGATQKVGGKELTWEKTSAKAFYIDFKELHPSQSEHVVAWAVAYLVSSEEKTGLTLKKSIVRGRCVTG